MTKESNRPRLCPQDLMALCPGCRKSSLGAKLVREGFVEDGPELDRI